jgi:hypothetical protein
LPAIGIEFLIAITWQKINLFSKIHWENGLPQLFIDLQ